MTMQAAKTAPYTNGSGWRIPINLNNAGSTASYVGFVIQGNSAIANTPKGINFAVTANWGSPTVTNSYGFSIANNIWDVANGGQYSLYLSNSSAFVVNDRLPDGSIVDSSIDLFGRFIVPAPSITLTNGLVWLSVSNNTSPNGSILTTTDGRFYVRSNSDWVLK